MILAANTKVYDLDTSIVRIKQMYVTPSGQSQSRPLVPTSLEQILEWSASNAAVAANTGSVTHYADMGVRKIYFYPTPSAADTITLYYVALPTALSANGDIPVLQEPYVTECILAGACFKAAVYLKDPDATLFKQEYLLAIQRFRGHLRRREGSMTRQFRLTRGDRVIPSDPSVDVRYF